MTTQHAAPDTVATQIVVASPVWSKTYHKAPTAPAQAGNSRIAMMVLSHLGMADVKLRASRRKQKRRWFAEEKAESQVTRDRSRSPNNDEPLTDLCEIIHDVDELAMFNDKALHIHNL